MEKKLSAIVWAIEKLYSHVHGFKFFMETSHQPLEALMSKKYQSPLEILQEYEFDIAYFSRKKNGATYSLS